MKKDKLPYDLAIDLSGRSSCNVSVAAVIMDKDDRVVSWHWNNSGPDGNGMCAERGALKRANPKRLPGSTIYVFGRWAHSGNWVTAIPCSECMALIRKHDLSYVYHSTKGGKWDRLIV